MMIAMKKEPLINVRPLKFIVWLFIASSIMLFGGWTSGYIVSRVSLVDKGEWITFSLPQIFMVSTILIVVSSATMHWARVSAKRLQFEKTKLALWCTMALGIAFLACQLGGWVRLIEMNMYFAGHVSGSYIYVISGFHGLHIIAGLGMITSCLTGLYRNIPQVKQNLRLEVTSVFWHFIDILWIYLYVFLLLNR
ncbi:MAG: cytochrome c oxidase subunit 3 [Solitalea sp.]